MKDYGIRNFIIFISSNAKMKRLDLILAIQLVEIVNNGSKYFFRRKKMFEILYYTLIFRLFYTNYTKQNSKIWEQKHFSFSKKFVMI